MTEFEQMEAVRDEIYLYVSNAPNKQITYHEAQATFPGCSHIIASMVIDEILVIREVDDEVVYCIVGSDFPRFDS